MKNTLAYYNTNELPTMEHHIFKFLIVAENTKGGSITAPFTSCLTGLE
jgi:hypothetical protein